MKNINLRTKLFKNKKILLLLLILIVGIGYAALSTTLNITGVTDISSASWDIHFVEDSINLTEGSVSVNTEGGEKVATIDNATQVSYHVKLTNPGDFYEFTVDVENTGSIDAMIDSISSKIKIGDSEEVEINDQNLPNYLKYSVTYSDNVEIAPHHLLESNSSETIKIHLEFDKDVNEENLPVANETLQLKFQLNYVQKDSTAIDVPHPRNLGDDDWNTIISNVQNGNGSLYIVGSTKEVDMGTLGTHTLRVANTSTPSECESTGFSQTACGFVLEFADIITEHRMNPYSQSGSVNGDGNKGGWEYSEMRTYLNSDIYNALPSSLKNSILNTNVVSGHGNKDTTNFTTTDKLYLLSTHEVWKDISTSDYDISRDTAYNNTRQLDYYKNLEITKGLYNSNTASYDGNYLGAIKQRNGSNSTWWLRSIPSYSNSNFYGVTSDGIGGLIISSTTNGVSPAFRLG